MLPADRPEFMRTLNGLAAIKGKELTTEALALWWSAMSRWTIEEFKSAASHLVSACQFMPTPYDFEQLRKAGEPTASEAWAQVLSGERLTGRALRAAQLVGGQYAIRHANVEKDLPHLARRFREAFEELRDVEDVREALPQLTGSTALPDMRNVLRAIK
jgi:hypothetical protein